jgi:hypothetical protein
MGRRHVEYTFGELRSDIAEWAATVGKAKDRPYKLYLIKERIRLKRIKEERSVFSNYIDDIVKRQPWELEEMLRVLHNLIEYDKAGISYRSRRHYWKYYGENFLNHILFMKRFNRSKYEDRIFLPRDDNTTSRVMASISTDRLLAKANQAVTTSFKNLKKEMLNFGIDIQSEIKHYEANYLDYYEPINSLGIADFLKSKLSRIPSNWNLEDANFNELWTQMAFISEMQLLSVRSRSGHKDFTGKVLILAAHLPKYDPKLNDKINNIMLKLIGV